MTPRLRHPFARMLAALAALACVCAAGVGPARADDGPSKQEPDLRPREVRGLNIQNTLGNQVPLDLMFTNVDGKQHKLGDFFNQPSKKAGVQKPVVLIMVYFRCPILCPMVLEKFTKTLNEIDFTVGSDYDAVVVSFDGRDTPEDAARQRANQLMFYRQPTTDSIRDGWTFLTCQQNKQAPEHLAASLGFEYRYIESSEQFAHGAAVYILTPEGKISRILTGLNYPSGDVRLALLEASQGKIGSLFDRFTLWCYHFDPNAGVYVVAANRIMQVGASGVAVILGVFIYRLLRAEKAKARQLAAAGAPVTNPPSSSSESGASPAGGATTPDRHHHKGRPRVGLSGQAS